MLNGTTKDKILEKYGITVVCQDTVGEWIIKLEFKYDYAVNNDYSSGHKNKDMNWYIWNFIDLYLLLERCMFRWTHMISDDSYQYKGHERKM